MPDTHQRCHNCGIFRAFGETYYSPNFSDPSKCGRAIRCADSVYAAYADRPVYEYDPEDADLYDWDFDKNNCDENLACCQCAKLAYVAPGTFSSAENGVIFCRQCNARAAAKTARESKTTAPKNATDVKSKNRLEGKTIVFTGALTMKRAEATAKAKAAGAKVTNSVSGSTDILIAGPGAGQKIHDAQTKVTGVEIWDEAQFLAEINAGGSDAPKSGSKKATAAAPPPESKKPAGKRTTKKAEASQEEEEEEEEEKEEEEEEEEPAAKKHKVARKAAATPAAAKTPAKRGAAKAAKQDGEPAEEPPAAATRAPAKRGAAKYAKDEEAAEATKPAPRASEKRSA
jgi:hypothetical protein